MAETYEHAGQKVTTSYKKTGTPVATKQNVSTSYKPTNTKSSEEKLEAHADRRAQNREIRDGRSKSPSPGESGAIKEYDEAPLKGKKQSKSNPLTGNAPPAARQSKKPPGGGGGGPFAAIAKGYGDLGNLARSMPAPTWMNDGMGKGKKGKGVVTSSPQNLPDWVMTGRGPWSGSPAPVAQNTVTKTIITKVHADGTRTRSTRAPTQRKAVSKKPNWINW